MAVRQCTFCGERALPLQGGLWGVPWISGKILLPYTKGQKKNACAKRNFLGPPYKDKPLTPVEKQSTLSLAPKGLSHMVLIFKQYKVSGTNRFWAPTVCPKLYKALVSHLILIPIFHGWHYILRLKGKIRLRGYTWSQNKHSNCL